MFLHTDTVVRSGVCIWKEITMAGRQNWRATNWAGMKFGKITLISDSGERCEGGQSLWDGICECQTPVRIRPSDAKAGKTISCGCAKFKDYTGMRGGKLVFIEPTMKKQSGKLLWKTRCDCGELIEIAPCTVLSGKRPIKSCGCSRIGAYEGVEAGNLTIGKRSTTKDPSGHHYYWHAMCGCGEPCLVFPGEVLAGKKKSCGCLNHKRTYEPIISSARKVWGGGYDDGCDFDTFYRLSQQPCHYCNVPPWRTYNVANSQRSTSDLQKEEGDFVYNGLDRIDSSRDHSPDNVVPCCSLCNRMKSDLPSEVFKQHIHDIHQHMRHGHISTTAITDWISVMISI